MFLIVFGGLSDSHPNLVGAAKRLIESGICLVLTEGLRSNCKVTGTRKWSHLNFPFTCRLCLQTCQCVRSLASDRGSDALRKLTKAGFQGILIKPPELQSEVLDLDFDAASFSSAIMFDDGNDDDCQPRVLKTSQDLAMLVLFEDGRYNGNIEYLSNLKVEEKNKIMNSLFTLFHIV